MKQRNIFTLIFLSFVLLSQGQSFGELHTVTLGKVDYLNDIHITDTDNDGDQDFLSCINRYSDISWLENNHIHASVEENETNNNLLVYPNPAGESINIKLEDAAPTDYEILLYNNLGMEIKHFWTEASQMQMSISTKELKPGIYYVVLKSGNNISTSKVLIVR